MKNIFTCLILFLTLGIKIAEAQEDANTSFDYYLEGVRHYCLTLEQPTEENFAKTFKLLQSAIEADSRNDAAYFYLALTCYNTKHPEEALKNLKKAEELDPQNFWYKIMTARLYSQLGENDMAINLYEKLIALHPRKTSAYYEVLDIYLQQNNFQKAFEYLDKIETVHGMNDMTANTRYALLMREGRKEEALQVLLKLDEEVDSPATSYMIAEAYKDQFKDTLALRYYDEAIRMNREYIPAYFGKAEIYRMRMDMEQFFKYVYIFILSPQITPDIKIDYVEKAIVTPGMAFAYKEQFDTLINYLDQAHPYDTTASNYTGLYRIATGDTLAGLKTYRDCIEHNPGKLKPYLNFIISLYQVQMWDELLKVSKEAIRMAPEDLTVNELTALSHWKKNEFDEAIAIYQNVLRIVPEDSPVRINCYAALGDLFHSKKNVKQAFKYYDRGLRLDPEYLPILNNYAYYLSLENRKLDKALQMSRKTVEKEPENSVYLDTYGWLLYQKGEISEAKSYLKKAITYGGKSSAAIMDHYAEILFLTGDYDLAFLYWTDAAKLDPTLGLEEKMKTKKQEIRSKK